MKAELIHPSQTTASLVKAPYAWSNHLSKRSQILSLFSKKLFIQHTWNRMISKQLDLVYLSFFRKIKLVKNLKNSETFLLNTTNKIYSIYRTDQMQFFLDKTVVGKIKNKAKEHSVSFPLAWIIWHYRIDACEWEPTNQKCYTYRSLF